MSFTEKQLQELVDERHADYVAEARREREGTQINIEPGEKELGYAVAAVVRAFDKAFEGLIVRDAPYTDDKGFEVEAVTLIVKLKAGVSGNFVREVVTHLCDAFEQDCAAVRWSDGTGVLIGPRAAKWGAFNPEYFQLFDEE